MVAPTSPVCAYRLFGVFDFEENPWLYTAVFLLSALNVVCIALARYRRYLLRRAEAAANAAAVAAEEVNPTDHY